MTPIQAVIFDFDGLILDTEVPIFQSWQELYQEHGQSLSLDVWATIIGTAPGTFDPLTHLETLVPHGLDPETTFPERLRRELELILAQPILPGVEDYLNTARRLGLKIGLASSSPYEWVHGHLERLGLRHFFDSLKTSEDVTYTKPDPELYLAVLAELGLQPDQAIVFEDSPNGILAAKRAGLYCVAVPNDLTRSLAIEHADRRLDSLASIGLEALIREVEAEGQP